MVLSASWLSPAVARVTWCSVLPLTTAVSEMRVGLVVREVLLAGEVGVATALGAMQGDVVRAVVVTVEVVVLRELLLEEVVAGALLSSPFLLVGVWVEATSESGCPGAPSSILWLWSETWS
jgi:hypothetical protein